MHTSPPILPFTYSTPYPMQAFICDIYHYCHYQLVFLFLLLTPVTVTLLAHCLPAKLYLYVSCTIPYDVCIYILCSCITCMLCTFTTCCFPSPSATQPPPPSPIFSRPTSSRWVPPYVPWFCLRFLPD